MTSDSELQLFPELFPDIHTTIVLALTRHFMVFQFSTARKLLMAHSRVVLKLAIEQEAILKLYEKPETREENLEALVLAYRQKITPCDDPKVTKICFPELYAFVEEKFYEQKDRMVFGPDIAACVNLLWTVTKESRSSLGWWRDPLLVKKVFGKWFV